jgi:hypothetical protein
MQRLAPKSDHRILRICAKLAGWYTDLTDCTDFSDFVQPFGLTGHVLLGEVPGRAEGDETAKYKSVVM